MHRNSTCKFGGPSSSHRISGFGHISEKYACNNYTSTGPNGTGCLIFAVVAVGNTYILSRETDYKEADGSLGRFCHFDYRYPTGESGNGKALQKGFDSHFVSVSAKEGYQIDDINPEFDEIVTHPTQVLPLCRVLVRETQSVTTNL